MSNWQGKNGPLLIAEIGGNHEGSFDYAVELTKLAIGSGADYIKFQIYTGNTLVNPSENPDRNRHFKKFELDPDQHIALAKMCRKHGVGYMASVWDPEALKWIDEHMTIYKIGSGDLTAYPILKGIAAMNKPVILSTGLSTTEEVLESVKFLQDQNRMYLDPENLAILQCTSMYPIGEQDAHLRIMKMLRQKTGLTVGYSDHTEGMLALEIAAALGAEVLEFHFTNDRTNKTFRDHKVSLTKEEVQTLTGKLKRIHSLMGDPVKKPLPIEEEAHHITTFRRALYPIRDLPAGHIIQAEDLITLRPNHGIDAREFERLSGSITRVPLKKYQKLNWSDFKNPVLPKCYVCGSPLSQKITTIRKKPAVEVDYGIAGQDYYRKIYQCSECKAYNNIHNLINEDSFYKGDYNRSIDPGLIKNRFKRIISIKPGQSDNKQRTERIINFMTENGVSNQGKVLDVGSGTCVFLYEFVKRTGFEAHCIDPDKAAIAHALQHVKVDRGHCGTILDFTPEVQYDIITFNKVLEHIRNPAENLRQAALLLSSDGFIYIELPEGDRISMAGLIEERAEFAIEHYLIFNNRSIAVLADRAGLKVVKKDIVTDPSGKYTIYAFLKKQHTQ